MYEEVRSWEEKEEGEREGRNGKDEWQELEDNGQDVRHGSNQRARD